MARADYFARVKVYSRVNEECVADAIASIVLARGGFKPNETADYIVHYSCDEWWVEQRRRSSRRGQGAVPHGSRNRPKIA